MFMGFLCRICRCLGSGPHERRSSAIPANDAAGEERAEPQGQVLGESQVDDLTAIRGIGIVIQNRLNQAGITTYAQLAEAKPEEVREVLGELSRGTKFEAWINQARELSSGK